MKTDYLGISTDIDVAVMAVSVRVCPPPGMEAALEGLARAVLKDQPLDIYVFAAEHFDTLVKKRSQGN